MLLRKLRRRFLKNKTKQKHSYTNLDEKNLPFHDVLYNFIFLYFSTARQVRLPYIIKDASSDVFQNSLSNEGD